MRNAPVSSRRDFLKSSGKAAIAFSIVPRHVLGGALFTAPSEEITRAVIGVGGMGQGHLGYTGARTVAICDVDQKHLEQALSRLEAGVTGHRDFREVLARADIDVVHIATPPHWHGLISAEAVKAGKDVWCEKPMTRTIGEGRRVVEAVQRHGAMFRLNTWFRFRDSFYGFGTPVQPIKKVVENRLLGWPLTITVGPATGFDWKFQWSGRTDLVPEPVPAELDYDFWLGPAPYKPYHTHRAHGTFRGYWDYDGGGLGDMGQHYLDPVQYLLEKDDTSPVAVSVDAPLQHPDAASSWRRIEMTYADGCKIVLDAETTGDDVPYIAGPEGNLYKGLRCDIPDFEKRLASLPEPDPQETDFYQAVRTRRKFPLNEANGHRSCTLVNLGVIAVRLGRDLRYDPEREEFPGDDAANRLAYQPMRSPWHI
ncbi:MAG: Inositol 2-dehydrogenase [Candidatus Hydrogenedentes bacterium ADurb.Bin179]|nr:MAG: Inositol 2-dehydrogenase [Candidatus Hydrogenedentes bacterium ADurb.Bin179]